MIKEDKKFKILVVSEDSAFSDFVKKTLSSDYTKVYSVSSSEGALSLLSEDPVQIIIVSQGLTDISCVDFLVYLKREFPMMIRILVSDISNQFDLIEAVNKGGVFKIIDRLTDKKTMLSIFEDCKAIYESEGAVSEKLNNLLAEVKTLNKIGISLTSEHNLEDLLEQIVHESRKLTNADAGSLYIVENGHLNFIISQTESLQKSQKVQDTQYKIFSLPITKGSIAGYVACTGDVLNIADVYEIPDSADYKFYSDFDKKMGYRTRSMLVVPIKDQTDSVIGVLQLINRIDFNGVVQIFEKEYEDMMQSLASQAGVAIKNAQLVKEIHQLLSSLIEYSATLIDARSSHTAGHSEGVNLLTQAIARAINEKFTGVFSNVKFSNDQLRELNFAAYLHDIGKIGIREKVLDKSAKLDGFWIDAVENRFKYIRKCIEQELIFDRIAQEGYQFNISKARNEIKDKLEEFDKNLKFIKRINTEGRLTDLDLKVLDAIAEKKYLDIDEQEKDYLLPQEYENLSVKRGNLTPEEKKDIFSHVEKTILILNKIPFPEYLKNVPYLAGTHHEKLDGSGYPKGLTAEKLSYSSRIIAVADYFEALVAFDRPYKPSKSIEEAKRIMMEEVKNNKLDPDIVNLLFEEKLYQCLQKKKHRSATEKNQN